jgi:bacterial peptide chain release factor 1 (bRF-1)
MDFLEQLNEVEARFEGLTRQMADPEVISDQETYRKVAKSQRDLEEIVGVYREYKRSVTT